jgi:sn-glycerol 3-phosphate transport system permease protein
MKSVRVANLIIKYLIGMIILFPLVYAILVSFMRTQEISAYPPKLLPRTLFLGNYLEVVKTIPLFRFILNSILVSTCITLGQIIICSMAAFAFAYFEIPGKKVLFMTILATMMIPWESITMANYLTIGALGWYDTYQALILPGIASAFTIFFIRQFFLTLPLEIYEAAKIDGCGNFRYLLRIALPLAKPALGALGIYTFLHSWNQYMWPLLVTNQTSMRTIQIGISMLQSSEYLSKGLVMAGITIVLIPSLLIFILGEKQIISGMTQGALKG